MSEIIDGVTVRATYMHGGMFLDLRVRAADKATLVEAMLAAGLLVGDPDRGTVDAPGSELFHIGHMVITKAVMNGDKVVTPAVMDDGHSANIRMRGVMIDIVEDADYPAGLTAVLDWMKPGSPVELFDPITPSVTWMGD